jgi:hypothetical protein
MRLIGEFEEIIKEKKDNEQLIINLKSENMQLIKE